MDFHEYSLTHIHAFILIYGSMYDWYNVGYSESLLIRIHAVNACVELSIRIWIQAVTRFVLSFVQSKQVCTVFCIYAYIAYTYIVCMQWIAWVCLYLCLSECVSNWSGFAVAAFASKPLSRICEYKHRDPNRIQYDCRPYNLTKLFLLLHYFFFFSFSCI